MNAHQEKLTRLLLDLGDDADSVAAYLEGQGCHGLAGYTMHCPVANYLTRATGYHANVGVTTASLTSGFENCVDLPPAVSGFVVRFDRGDYPHLRTSHTKGRTSHGQ